MNRLTVQRLNIQVETPEVPAFYNARGAAAWQRGLYAAAAWPGQAVDVNRENPYQARYMRRAWLAGWDALETAVRAAGKVL